MARERALSALPVGQPDRLQGPSSRPGEPVQAGLPIGPGAGPAGVAQLSTLDRLRAIYAAHPNDDLRAMIEWLSSGRGR